MKKLFAALAAVGMLVAFAGVAQAAPNPRVFNSVPNQLPQNVSSYGPEAYAFKQLGDAIHLAPGKRALKTVNVVMSDWACQTGTWFGGDCVTTPGTSFAQAITFNIYNLNPNGTVGTSIASRTQTFQIKFRPSSDDVNCPLDNQGNTHATAYFVDGVCYHGLAQTITFNFGAQNVTLPMSRLVYGIEYNTTHYGPNPVGEATPCFGTSTGCPYDALNIGAAAGVPKRGQDLNLAGFDVDATAAGLSAIDSPCTGSGTPNVFGLDDGCQTGLNPLVRFIVKR